MTPRYDNAEAFARHNHVLLLQHKATNIAVDLSLGMLPFEFETVERSRLHRVETIEIRIPTPEDLIIQKAIAHRPKDMADIEAVITSQPKLDWERIRHWVQQFADVLERPEIWTDIAHFAPKTNFLKQKAKSKRKK